MHCTKPAEFGLNRNTWSGPKDCSFRFGTAYNEKYLYIAVDVTDEKSSGRTSAKPWRQDAVEVRLDVRPENRWMRKGRSEAQRPYLLFLMNPGGKPEETAIYEPEKLPEGARAVCLRTPTGHATEIAVPIEYLNEYQGGAWKAFRLNVAADDLDAAREGVQIRWRPAWQGGMDYPGSGRFVKSMGQAAPRKSESGEKGRERR